LALIRLHKFLANSGVASRRKAEEMMFDGLVSVNGEIVSEPGSKVDPEKDKIKLNGKIIKYESKKYVLLHKPRGYVTTASDDLGRRTVLDLIEGIDERIYPVGRLDRDSEGLLVLTNDGELAQYLTHPSCEVTKTYRVTVEGYVEESIIKKIREGVRVGGKKVIPKRVKILHRNSRLSRIEIEVGEGMNREIRRIFASVGHEARKLIRIKIGPLSLEKLPKGRARFLTSRELSILKRGMEEQGLEISAPVKEKSGKRQAKTSKKGRTNHSSQKKSSGTAKNSKSYSSAKPQRKNSYKKSGAEKKSKTSSSKPRSRSTSGKKSKR
jgi:pseudouridine synthase